MTTDSQQEFPAASSSTTYGTLVRLLVGVLLLLAAILKAHQLLTVPVSGDGFFDSYPLRIVIVELELILGGWLVCGISQIISRRVVFCFVLLFASSTSYKVITGASSCGCFGVLNVNPWFTLILDALLIAGLALWKPSTQGANVPVFMTRNLSLLQHMSILVIAMTGVIFAIVALLSAPTRELPIISGSNGDSQLVLLEPETWVGKRLPISKYINKPDLTADLWLVVFYHDGCKSCQAVVPEFQQIAREWKQTAFKRQIVFIRVPDGEDTIDQLVNENFDYAHGQLNNSYDWFMPTPTVLVVDNGLVRNVITHNVIKSAKAVQEEIHKLRN